MSVTKTTLPIPISNIGDLFWPRNPGEFDVVISFACHTTVRALWMKHRKQVKTVVHWNIDYSPRRFKNCILNRVYNSLDKFAVRRADFHVELTQRAMSARLKRYRQVLRDTDFVIPVGINTQCIPHFDDERFGRKRIAFIGNLTVQQGVIQMIEAFAIATKAIPSLQLDVIGDGEIRDTMTQLAHELGVHDAITFHGRLEPEEFRTVLNAATVGLAPFLKNENSFSNFADPSKVKNYLEAGLPVLISSVPEIASKLEESECALICEPDRWGISAGLIEILNDYSRWESMCAQSMDLARTLDWVSVLRPLNDVLLEAGS